MQVEIYKVENPASEPEQLANDAVACELIQELGLEGQQSFTNQKTLTRVPFSRMTLEEMFIFSRLFEETKPIESYCAEIIPVEVLQLYKEAKELNFFDKFEVWSPKKAELKDPVLVGIHKHVYNKEHGWSDTHYYTLARWGEALLPLEQLFRMTISKMRSNVQNAILKAEHDLKKIEILEANGSGFPESKPWSLGGTYSKLNL